MTKFNSDEFIKILKSLSGPNLFNPYTDICKIYDPDKNAPVIRTNNLKRFLDKLDSMDSMLVGEAPGYRGCRRTGYAFTDEFTFPLAKKIFGVDLRIATNADQPGKIKMKEPSASFVWKVLDQIIDPPFLWNIEPLHPENPKSENFPLSNRAPTKKELKMTEKAILYLLDNADFDIIHAVGRKAEEHLTKLGYDVKYIRHCSHGGSNKFRDTMFEEYQKIKPAYQKSLGDDW